ncbi:hypothetical protein [Nonomuraea jabiensis]|uniref:Acyltransferase n=1 Tax=Nonomuraea jabiensis TaxID=882448 RepID=A0A7W9GJ11_9ACTN|nr:hypothetical protein [Nonomuraea jabiensis]MBB5784627.1 hypothetical protein [Nonomuraea jabiensis]
MFAFALVAGALFVLLYALRPQRPLALVRRVSVAAGAMLTYAWHSFPWQVIVRASPAADLAGNAVMTVAAAVLLVFAARRVAA